MFVSNAYDQAFMWYLMSLFYTIRQMTTSIHEQFYKNSTEQASPKPNRLKMSCDI